MAIKVVSPYGVTGLINASGGWSSTPRGGIIPFSANVSILEPKDKGIDTNDSSQSSSGESADDAPKYSVGAIYTLKDIGNFYITSVATKTTADGAITTLSLACILGYRSNTGTNGGLGSCSEYKAGSTVQSVIDDLCDIAGIPKFSMPLGSHKVNEPVWLYEGESALSKIVEIITANGCVLYSTDGTNVVCETLLVFVKGLSGDVSKNTLDVNNVSFPSKIPGGAVINGSLDTVKDTPLSETLESKKDSAVLLTGNQLRVYDWTTKITTVTRDFVNRTITYVEKTTSPSPMVEQEKTVVTVFELPKTVATTKVPLDVSSCYPVDPGRMVKKSTIDMRNVVVAERPMWLSFYTSIDANKYFNYNYKPPTITSKLVVSEIQESWTYQTKEIDVNFGSPSSIVPEVEKVYYNRVEYRVPALITPELSSVTLGEKPSFIKNKDLVGEIINDWVPVNLKDLQDKPDPEIYDVLFTYEVEEIAWKKDAGSNKWVGKQTLARCFAEEGLDQARERVKEFIDTAIRNGTPEQLYKDEFLKFREVIQSELLEVVPKFEIVKQDWDPKSTIPSETMPKDYEIYRQPYVFREKYTGDGGLINLTAGTFNSFSGAKTAADGIRYLEQARSATLTVTNIGEVFKVGDCDSPSFSISSDGIRCTGVYLNGSGVDSDTGGVSV